MEGVSDDVMESLKDALLSCKVMMQKKGSTHYVIEVN